MTDRERMYALIFNAITEVNPNDDRWWIFSQRKAATDRIMAALASAFDTTKDGTDGH